MNLFDVYSLYDIEPKSGNGCYVYDAEGNEYLDLYGGHAVISIGHSHPTYIKAISEQVSKLGFYSNSVQNYMQSQLAERLGNLSGYNDYSLFLCNSGAEANENAFKLASFHTGRKKVLAFNNSFHGRTSGAVAATDNPKIVSPFNQTPNVEFVPLNDINAVEEKLSEGDFCAVIIEGIQGVAGIRMVDDDFLVKLHKATKSHGAILILDEIQSGYGRTGKFFAHQYSGIRPDLITCAKGIANGFPMGAVLISKDFKPVKGMLGTTFGGSHLACAAAIAVLDVMERENLISNAKNIGEYMISKLSEIEGPLEIRGRGLMIGIEIKGSAPQLRKKLLYGHRIFTGGAGEHTVRLLSALTITKTEADIFLSEFSKAINS
ncbi:MAG TPA: aminotransferase class III-fold pyridoxal phosphate-dependent enzyme [Muribaculaceae bacterium]|nr:aminotransferase class III-fold pyridoxal phosphate-dependent enzyme [Muribaculaceae bacterium]